MATAASAPPIVLIHGLCLTPRSWQGFDWAALHAGAAAEAVPA